MYQDEITRKLNEIIIENGGEVPEVKAHEEAAKETHEVLDPCCGSRKFYFDKRSPFVIYGDIRDETYVQCDGRLLEIKPDQQMDVTNLPFDDESFSLVVFDPPHLKYAGKSSYMYQSYGALPDNALDFLRDGFNECWRVLKKNGTLIFKWNECQIRLPIVLRTIGKTPLFGNRKPCGRRAEVYWMVFFKGDEK